MTKLTAEQIEALHRLPLDGRPNRLRMALALVNSTQSDLVEATGYQQPYVSDVMRGRFERISVDKAQGFADALGCDIKDLFPSKVA